MNIGTLEPDSPARNSGEHAEGYSHSLKRRDAVERSIFDAAPANVGPMRRMHTGVQVVPSRSSASASFPSRSLKHVGCKMTKGVQPWMSVAASTHR